MWKNKYRVVTDDCAGYEAQIKYWWFPFVWIQMTRPGRYNRTHEKWSYIPECSCNTYDSLEGAEAQIRTYIKTQAETFKPHKKQKVVKMIT